MEKFIEQLKEIRLNPRKMRNSYLESLGILQKINELVPNDFNNREKMDIVILGEYNKCYCGELSKPKSLWCSITCKNKDPISRKLVSIANTNNNAERLEKAKNTRIERYGVSSVQDIPASKIKTKNTLMEKYGVDSWSKTDEAKIKLSEVWSEEKKKNYNTKIQKTCIEKYGVDHYSKTKEYIEKRNNTTLLQTDGKYFNHFQDVDKIKIANTNKYGVNSWKKTDEGKQFTVINNPMKRIEIALKSRLSRMSKKYSDEFIGVILSQDNSKFKLYIDDTANKNLYTHRNQIAKHLGISYSYLNNLFRQNGMNNEYLTLGTSRSYKEQEVCDFINSLGVIIKRGDRTVLNGKEIDILIEDKKLGIEFNGIYYHTEFTGGKDKYYHLNKTEIAESKGYQILHILETEWDNPIKRNIWQSIIKSKLGLLEEKIYARKCKVNIISPSLAREFYNNNHLSGFIGANIHYGLLYNNEIVSMISYGKSRFNKTENEIYRFASKLNCQVIGALGKLISKLPQENLICYADRRISGINSAYSKFFKNKTITPPNWWGMECGVYELKHRLNFTKRKIKSILLSKYDDSKNTFDNMFDNGFDIIWDSGSLKFYN